MHTCLLISFREESVNVQMEFIFQKVLYVIVIIYYVTDHASFNEKPFVESKKSFSAKYVGSIEVSKPTGNLLLGGMVVYSTWECKVQFQYAID